MIKTPQLTTSEGEKTVSRNQEKEKLDLQAESEQARKIEALLNCDVTESVQSKNSSFEDDFSGTSENSSKFLEKNGNISV